MVKRYIHHANAQGPSHRRALLVKRKRVSDVMRMMVECPDATQAQMAARLGCSQQSVSKYVRDVFHELLEVDRRGAKYEVLIQANQLKHILSKALAAFERSQQNVERVTTEYTPISCRACGGRGNMKAAAGGKGKRCPACEGKGTTLVERTTRQVTGQAGDSSFLTTAINALRHLAKLRGLYRTDVVGRGDRPQINVNIDWSRVSDVDVLNVRRIIAMAAIGQKESLALDAKSVPVLDDKRGK